MTTILPLPTVTHHFSSHPPRNWPATGRSCLACEELSWPCCTSMATSKRLIWLTISNDQNMSKPLNTCCDPGEHKHSSWIGGSIWVFSPRIWHLNAFEVFFLNIYIYIIIYICLQPIPFYINLPQPVAIPLRFSKATQDGSAWLRRFSSPALGPRYIVQHVNRLLSCTECLEDSSRQCLLQMAGARKKQHIKTSVEDASEISKLQTLQDQPPRFTKIIQDRSSSARCPGCHIRPSGARNAGHHPQTSKRPARLHRQSEHGLTSRRRVYRYNLGNWHFGPLAKVRASWFLVRMLLQKRLKNVG